MCKELLMLKSPRGATEVDNVVNNTTITEVAKAPTEVVLSE